jgi:hypothetical protein
MGQHSVQHHSLCSVCDQPMMPGQAFNGLKKAHWDCAKPAVESSITALSEFVQMARRQVEPKPVRPASAKEEIRFSWIEKYLRESGETSVDIVSADFMWAYIEAHDVKAGIQMVGAPSCPQAGKDLSRMFKLGRLDRYRLGMPHGDACNGFPKWVYSYELAKGVRT